MGKMLSYAAGINEAHHYLLKNYPEVFFFGQGLWSPWYVGSTMKDLDKTYGKDRVIDSPVSEVAVTGAALGAATCGYRPIVVHPRVDFMILAIDQIVSQAAKWSSMFGGQVSAPLTIRGIVNRGGEQGAQHSQALHSWFSHVPGLRVVMPATAHDARDLLIASVLSNDPVLYIDDRWLYDVEEDYQEIKEIKLADQGPAILKEGNDITIVASGYSVLLAQKVAGLLVKDDIDAEVIDLRVVNPLKFDNVIDSVNKTGQLFVIDCGWKNCGLAGEVIASVMESISPGILKGSPKRFTLTDAPAPTSKPLERLYYHDVNDIYLSIRFSLEKNFETTV